MNRRTLILSVTMLVLAALVVGFAIGWLAHPPVADPFNGVPACTDVIADAGGICHGEPR